MSREKLKDILESIGFAAIIASLIFVGIETRNSTRQAELNTQALEIASYQELMNNITELNLLTLENPDVAELMRKAFATDEELTVIENYRFTRAAFARLRHGDIAYFQYSRGAISADRLSSAFKVVNLGNPRMREFWEDRQGNFVQDYQDYVNGYLAEIDARESSD